MRMLADAHCTSRSKALMAPGGESKRQRKPRRLMTILGLGLESKVR